MTDGKIIGRTKQGVEIGAWLLKCNPEMYDIEGEASQSDVIETWRLNPTYRVDLMSSGDPCCLWVTGSVGASPEPGIWAVGEVTGKTYIEKPGDGGLWTDDDEAGKRRPFVPTFLGILDTPIRRDVATGWPEWTDAEVFRQPQGGNPMVLTPEQWGTLVGHLEKNDLWPVERFDSELDDRIEEILQTTLEERGFAVRGWSNDRSAPTIEVTRDGQERLVYPGIFDTGSDTHLVLRSQDPEALRQISSLILAPVRLTGEDEAAEVDIEVLPLVDPWAIEPSRYDSDAETYDLG